MKKIFDKKVDILLKLSDDFLFHIKSEVDFDIKEYIKDTNVEVIEEGHEYNKGDYQPGIGLKYLKDFFQVYEYTVETDLGAKIYELYSKEERPSADSLKDIETIINTKIVNPIFYNDIKEFRDQNEE